MCLLYSIDILYFALSGSGQPLAGQSMKLAFMHGSPHILEGGALMRSKGKFVELEKSNISSLNICKKKFDVKVKT